MKKIVTLVESNLNGDGGATQLEKEVTIYDIARHLHDDLSALEFVFQTPSARQAREQQTALLGQLSEHLLPRLKELSSPAVIVIAGSTGAGKSTLLNSVLDVEASPASVLRPTTRNPVVVFNPKDEELLNKDRFGADMTLVAVPSVPRGIVLIDAPDLDSLEEANRLKAVELLEKADMWLFVTTAARYGDALPWEVLSKGMKRGTSVAMVLNRVESTHLGAIRNELSARLREHELDQVPLFTVAQREGLKCLLNAKSVAPLRTWLHSLGGVEHSKTVVLKTLRGALETLPQQIEKIRRGAQNQQDLIVRLQKLIQSGKETAVARVITSLENGDPAQGQVASLWQAREKANKLTRPINRFGYAKSSRALLKRRQEFFLELDQAVSEAVVLQIRSAVKAGHQEIALGIKKISNQGIKDTNYHIFAELPTAEICETFRKRTLELVTLFLENKSRINQRIVKSFGVSGFTTIVQVAVLGHSKAKTIVDTLVGYQGNDLLREVQENLQTLFEESFVKQSAKTEEQLAHWQKYQHQIMSLELRQVELKAILKKSARR